MSNPDIVEKVITASASVLVIHGESGFGKKHLVQSTVQKHNDRAKQAKERIVLHTFTPAGISTDAALDSFKQLLANKDVTGRTPVIMLTQFHGLTNSTQREIVDSLLPPKKYKKHVQRRLAIRRNPVIILTDGSQDKYDSRVSRLITPFQSIVIGPPRFQHMKNAIQSFAVLHKIDIPDLSRNRIAGSCSNFHVLNTKLREILYQGTKNMKGEDAKKPGNKFFENIRALRVPNNQCFNLKQTHAIFQELGESSQFAVNTLQMNPPAYETVWRYLKTPNGCEKKELVKTVEDQLSQYCDTYSEMDTMSFSMQEELQGVTVRSAVVDCKIKPERYYKLNFPQKMNNGAIVSSLNMLKNEYTTHSMCSNMAALERYDTMKTAHRDKKEIFIPINRQVNNDPELTEAMNAQIISHLLVMNSDETPKRDTKRKHSHIQKREHQLQPLLPQPSGSGAVSNIIPKRHRQLY